MTRIEMLNILKEKCPEGYYLSIKDKEAYLDTIFDRWWTENDMDHQTISTTYYVSRDVIFANADARLTADKGEYYKEQSANLTLCKDDVRDAFHAYVDENIEFEMEFTVDTPIAYLAGKRSETIDVLNTFYREYVQDTIGELQEKEEDYVL